MIIGDKAEARKKLAQSREELKRIEKTGDISRISLAKADLGFALFQVRKFEDGLEAFDEAIELTGSLQDVNLLAQCLGIKALAYQVIGRLPDAYKTAEEVLILAEENDSPELKCDAYASMGQILLESGEPNIAFEKLNKARQIADEIDDERRLMNVLGALGNHSLAVAATEEAQAYFEKAMAVAISFDDSRAEHGFLGNIGTILSWNGRHSQAAEAFEKVLSYLQKTGDQEKVIQALWHLTQIYSKLQDDEKVLAYANLGVELTEGKADEETFTFLEALIIVHYRKDQIEEAHTATQKAIHLARSAKDRDREVDFLLSLGESYTAANIPEQALEAYRSALEGAKKLQRQRDEAYLTGRMGFTLAELNRLDEAIPYHERAIHLARKREIPELEGEQLSLLAMAHLENGELDKAREHCSRSVKVYEDAGLEEAAILAYKLLKEIESAEQEN